MLLRLLAHLILCYGVFPVLSNTQFNPREYPKQIATCKTTKRTPKEEIVDLALRYVDINTRAENTIVMVHGWPSLWSTWSNQIQAFKDDYHLVVPDLRAFGESTHPGDVRSSGTMPDLVGDLVCVLEHAKVTSAICMGHDWGSQICYQAARSRPDIFTAVVGVTVPYLHESAPFVSMEELVPHFPSLAYQVYFNSKTDEAIAELNKDIRRSVRSALRTVDSPPPDQFLRSVDSFLDAYSGVVEIPPVPFFTPNEEDYFVEQYGIQGFNFTLQFYMQENRYAAWKLANEQGNHTISQPVLAVYPSLDPVADWVAAAGLLKSHNFLPHLTFEVLAGAHWPHIEDPKKFNEIVRSWLQKLKKVDQTLTSGGATHIADEL